VSFKTRLLSTRQDESRDESQNTGRYPQIPDLLRFHQLDVQRYPYLLKSSAARENNTQYDILIACPQYQLTLDADKSLHCSDSDVDLSASFLDTLEVLFQKEKNTEKGNDSNDAPPFTGGWFVFLSYEMAEEIEPCLSMPRLPDSQPLAVATRCPAAIVIDKQSNQCYAIAETAYAYLLDEIEKDFFAIQSSQQVHASDTSIVLESLLESDPEPYLEQVEKIKRYIIDGDIFQANLSRQWRAVLKHDVTDAVLFDALSRMNPSSFAALACFENMTVISSSPERLVSLRDGIVETRPIAGTRPRDMDQRSDEALAEELLSHPKERAEHIMLIDLERNDLGRVCRPGTIEVNELMVLESWQHVHHIVSNVRGQLVDGRSPIDVLRAVFPGGTITGCPKVRCIEILAELEQQARGAYTGSLGYINREGSMDFNILIRTMVRDKTSNEISFRAGGGIVSDSVALNELEETRAKAKGLLKIFSLDDECDDQ
jgi:anthranilate synthase component 1